MDKPQISVIIPVYNAEKYIAQTLDGLLEQTFSDFEIICVNDCSMDGSLAVVRTYEEKDSRIKCIDLKENVGAGQARNIGVDASEGEYITFIDSDDTVEKDLFRRAFEATDGGTISEVVWGAVEDYYNEDGALVRTVPIKPMECCCKTAEEIAEASICLEEQTLFGYLWNSLYRADIIKENKLKIRDALFYEDYFLNLDFIKCAESLKVIDYIGYHYCKRANLSVTHRFTKDYFDLSYERIESFYKYCAENGGLTEKAKSVLGNRLIRYTLSALARNNNPLSEMDGKARREWIVKMCDMPLYNMLIKSDFQASAVSAVIKFLIEKKAVTALSVIGKIVYRLKK